MQEVAWHGTVAILDKPTTDGKTLHYDRTTWMDLPLTVWSGGQPVGVVKHVQLWPPKLFAAGTLADGNLIGWLLRGKTLPVSPNVKVTKTKQVITALTVVRTASWDEVGIKIK